VSSTHLSLHYHLIFSTKHRCTWIKESWEARLHTYLGGTLRGLGGVAESIGGDADHVHILASLKAIHCLADIMRELKSSSSHWVHEAIGINGFAWQDGYGAFTVGTSELEWIKRYIREQKDHHRKKTFQEEYLELLRQSGVDFDERYLW
jgi:putative transposase